MDAQRLPPDDEVGLLETRQVELLNGEIVEMPPDDPEHAQQNTNAADYLQHFSSA